MKPQLQQLAFASAALAVAAVSFAQTPVAPRAGSVPLETFAEVSIAAGSPIAEGTRPLGDLSSVTSRVGAIRTTPIDAQSAWLVGGSWQRFEFRTAGNAPIPHLVHALALKLGYNRQLDPRWSLRAEIDPGFYGEMGALGGRSFNAPIGLRFVRASSRTLQWVAGLNIDFMSDLPVIGGIGARWQVTPDVLVLAMAPAPRVEWKVAPDTTVFAGASLRSGAFRTTRDFGRKRGRPSLDGLVANYREIGAGVGMRYQVAESLALNLAAGWLFDRRFEFDARNLLLNGDGAPTVQLTLSGAF